MSIDQCLQLLVPLGAVVSLWLRLEHRLTRVEDKVKERYRDRQELQGRIANVEKWLPKPPTEI
jgi:hypothetical protein